MRILGKKWLMLAAALPVAALIACSSDAPVQVLTPSGQVYDEDEYNELVEAGMVDEMGNVIVEDEDEEDDDAAGTDTKKSSSSKAGTSSGSTDSKTSASSTDSGDSQKSSSSTADDAGDESSSAGSEVTSSEGGSGDTVKSSSSAADNASSSSVAASSSSAAAGQTTVSDGNGNFSLGTDDMEDVSTGEQSELDSLKEILDNGGTIEGFEEVATEFDENTLTYESFDEGDYYCFTGEGEWMHVTRDLLGKYIPHYRNGQAWGNLRHFDVKFMDACEGVYFRRKS